MTVSQHSNVRYWYPQISVSDPYSFDTDPGIQHFRLNTDLDAGFFLQLEKKLNLFFLKNTIYYP
jgi:hypothetical protein